MKTMKIDDTVVTNEITTHNSSTDFEINEIYKFINILPRNKSTQRCGRYCSKMNIKKSLLGDRSTIIGEIEKI